MLVSKYLLIFMYLFCLKKAAIDSIKTFITQEWLNHIFNALSMSSLNHIFNALSIGVQYGLSLEWTNFGLKCLKLDLKGQVFVIREKHIYLLNKL